MRTQRRFRAGLLLAGLWAAAVSSAADETLAEDVQPFALPAATLLEAAATPAARDKFAAVVQHEASRFEFDERQRLTLTSHRIYRIDSASAITEFGQVNAVWDPSRQHRPTIRARVVTRDGREHQFDPATLSDESVEDPDPRIYDDVRMLRGPLPAITVGSVVEVETIIVDQEPPFESGRSLQAYLGINGAVERTVIRVSAPTAIPLRYATRKLPDARITEETRDGRREITLRHGPLAIELEKLMVEALGDLPIWPEFLFSTGESWPVVASAYEKLAVPFIRPDEVRSLLPKELPAERDELIASLLAILHERVRYTGVLFGQGKIVPNPPSVALERRFGDCKDKAVIFASMLRAAGLPAQIVLLNADTGVDLDPDLPGIGGFNHMIVHVPGEQPLWIDPTVEHLRVGDLPMEDSNRWALLIGEAGTPLVRTPELQPSDNYHQETREIQLMDFGPADMRIEGRMNGTDAVRFRHSWSDKSGAAVKRRDESLKQLYSAESIEKFDTGDDPGTGFLTYAIEVKGNSDGNTEFAEGYVSLSLWRLYSDMPFGLRNDQDLLEQLRPDTDDEEEESAEPPRSADWVFEPFIAEWRIQVKPPHGFQLRALPESRDLTFGPAQFTQRFERQANGDVIGTIRLDSSRGRYTAEEGLAFRKTYLQHESDLNVELRFDHDATILMRNGEEAQAVRRHAELTSAEPRKAIHRIRAATDLLELGLFEEARAEALKATEIEPKNGLAFIKLGTVLEHNELGQRFGRGFDRAGALRAHREAIRLEADKVEYQLSIAAIAEHNSEGQRYGPGADLELAISTYRRFLEERPEWLDGKGLLIQSLWHAGRFEEIATVAADLPDDSRVAPLRLAARAMSAGVEIALREDASRGDSASHRQRVQSALPFLWFRGHYDQAREMIAASGVKSRQDPSGFLLQLLSNTVHEEALAPPPDTAAGVAEAVMRLTMRQQTETKALLPLISERLQPNGDAEWLANKFVGVQRAANGDISAYFGQNPAFLRDIAQSNFQFQETDAAGGAKRVAVLMNGMAVATMYLLPESKGWRVLTLLPYWHPIGREVLALLDARDTATARAWLELIREEAEDDRYRESGWMKTFTRALPRSAPPEDEAAMRLAAHMLLVGPEMLVAKIDAVRKASEIAATDDQRAVWQIVLFLAAREQDDHALMISAAANAFTQDPTSADAFWYRTTAYSVAGRWEDSERSSREWLAKEPGDDRPLQMLVSAMNAQGRAVEGLELIAPPVRRGRANANQLNNYAWQALVADVVDNTAVIAAESAFNQRQQRDYASGHTLACLYAVTGRILDARRLMIKMIDELPRVEPLSGDIWLIRGLIAEHLGATDTAIKAYRKIEKPKAESPGSVYDIAVARLAKIDEQQESNP